MNVAVLNVAVEIGNHFDEDQFCYPWNINQVILKQEKPSSQRLLIKISKKVCQKSSLGNDDNEQSHTKSKLCMAIFIHLK